MTSGFLGFGVAFPEHSFSTTESREALRRIWPRLRQAGGVEPGPGVRHTVEPLERVIAAHGLGDAMKLYAQHAPALAESAARGALRMSGTQPGEVDVVVSVSCTGYLVPSLGAHLVRRLGLRPDVVRLPLTELGCSGGSAAIAAAHRHLVAATAASTSCSTAGSRAGSSAAWARSWRDFAAGRDSTGWTSSWSTPAAPGYSRR